jgi:hypothetical protein
MRQTGGKPGGGRRARTTVPDSNKEKVIMLNTVTLPNGLKIANVTPHAITFWTPEWSEPIEVPPSGKVVNAKPNEVQVGEVCDGSCGMPRGKALEECGCGQPGAAALVNTEFVPQADAEEILAHCESIGALPVGSIIAAQAYPGRVVAMTPAPGYERVAVPLPKPVQAALARLIDGYLDTRLNEGVNDSPLEETIEVLRVAMHTPTKRMNPNKFTIFSPSFHPEDGVYAVKDGKHVKIDSFTWGYEGEAPVAAAKVIRKDGTNCLVYGAGMDFVTDGVVWSAK